MSDVEFIERAERILANAKASCLRVRDIVDVFGEPQGFGFIQSDSPYLTTPLLKRMLQASAGASETELFSIAAAISLAMPEKQD